MRRIFLNLDQVTSNELGSKTLTQLRDIAKEIGIKSVSKYKKWINWTYKWKYKKARACRGKNKYSTRK